MAVTRENRVPIQQLCHGCDANQFDFETTDDLDDTVVTVGQARAVEAIEFGLGIERDGYNIYAAGTEGLDKRRILEHYVRAQAQGRPVPDEFCYVNNFEAPHEPRLLRVPAGRGHALEEAMARFVVDVKGALQTAFSGEEYRSAAQAIHEEAEKKQNEVMKKVREKAQARGIAVMRTPVGFGLAPLKDAQVIAPQDFQKLPEEEQKRIEEDIEELQKDLQEALQEIPQWVGEARERMKELNQQTASFAVRHLIEKIKSEFSDLPQVLGYLDEVLNDVTANAETFLNAAEGNTVQTDASRGGPTDGPSLNWRYRVNLLVDHADSEEAPIIYEDEPSLDRLVGRIEHRSEMGALTTDFNLIRAGSLHRANGGYLIVDVLRLLRQPMAYDALKRNLESGRIRIEPMARLLGFSSTTSLEPEPVPLEVKVVAMGDRRVFHLLAAHDPDFRHHFKVLADFDEVVDRSQAYQTLFARRVAGEVRAEGLKPFGRDAVGKLVEYAARQAEDSTKLTADQEWLQELMREADHLAGKAGHDIVDGADVAAARAARIRRHNRVAERMQEAIERDFVLIDTDSAVTGQVNGLAVYGFGETWFGKPNRITARVRLGRGDVVDIEREVKLGGPLHSKGVLILSGYLGSHYAPDEPLSLSASLVFEQSYGGVEGDSASAAELLALLSALAEAPVKQGLAVTGSVNQRGSVQAIGGVNEKIEGFFDVCAARGLTGEQGVLIPAANVANLMLDERVVDAAREGRFHIYAVETVDQALEVLTDRPAGARDENGGFPEDSVNAGVRAKLLEFAEHRRRYALSGSDIQTGTSASSVSGEEEGGSP